MTLKDNIETIKKFSKVRHENDSYEKENKDLKKQIKMLQKLMGVKEQMDAASAQR